MPNSNIPTNIPIKFFTLDGVEIPLAGGGAKPQPILTASYVPMLNGYLFMDDPELQTLSKDKRYVIVACDENNVSYSLYLLYRETWERTDEFMILGLTAGIEYYVIRAVNPITTEPFSGDSLVVKLYKEEDFRLLLNNILQ